MAAFGGIMPDEAYLTRKQAADYLARNGCPVTARTLERMAANNNGGKGPPFYRAGWNVVRYRKADLDAWRAGRMQRIE